MARQEFNPERTINYWMDKIENPDRRGSRASLFRLIGDVVKLSGKERWSTKNMAVLPLETHDLKGRLELKIQNRRTRSVSFTSDSLAQEAWILTRRVGTRGILLAIEDNFSGSNLGGRVIRGERVSRLVRSVPGQALLNAEALIWDAYRDVLEQDYPGARVVGPEWHPRYELPNPSLVR